MAEKTETYLGVEIVVDEESSIVRIAGDSIEINKSSSGGYSCAILPYQNFQTLDELAKAVVMNSPDYDTLGK